MRLNECTIAHLYYQTGGYLRQPVPRHGAVRLCNQVWAVWASRSVAVARLPGWVRGTPLRQRGQTSGG